MSNRHVKPSFDEFLEEEGLPEVVEAAAIERTIARRVEEAMAEQRLSKAEMTRRMRTSRAALDRLLDPDNSPRDAAHVPTRRRDGRPAVAA